MTISMKSRFTGSFAFLLFIGICSDDSASGQGSSIEPQTKPAPVEVPVAQIDVMLAKERLRKVYGEMALKLGGDWLVTANGRAEKWRWNPEKGVFVCPADQKDLCAELVPTAFKWWGRGKGWMQEWNAEARESFDFGQSRNDSGAASLGTGSAEEDPNVEEVKTFQGKKTADELWSWKSGNGQSAKLSISMRDQKIERLETGDGVEKIEWVQKTPQSVPELSKLFLERGSNLASFVRIK